MNDVDYAGFWIRTLAAIVDTIMIMFIVFPLLFLIYGEKYLMSESVILGYWDVMLNYVLPAIVIILFGSSPDRVGSLVWGG